MGVVNICVVVGAKQKERRSVRGRVKDKEGNFWGKKEKYD